MRCLLKLAVQKDHISEVEISYSSNKDENNPTYEEEEVDRDDDQRGKEEETNVAKTVKAVSKRNKPSLKSESDQGIEQKVVQSNPSAALLVAKITISTHDLQIVQ